MNKPPKTGRRTWITRVSILLGVTGIFLPLLVTWTPELRYYYIRFPAPPANAAHDALKDRNPRTCSEFARTDLTGLSELDRHSLDAALRGLATHKIVLPRFAQVPFTPAFSQEDLTRGGGREQLHTASLIVLDLFVEAWRSSGDATYLRRAQRYLNGWQTFERQAWLPRGFLWNDHAVAARVFALTRFLCSARNLPEFSEADAAAVLQLISASGERLMKPEYFSFRTNHGVMQNLALMHIAASFPTLPQARHFAEIGTRRFAEQLDVYVSPEGAINEHSAGYHAFGTMLLTRALLYFEALGIAAPPDLGTRLAKARNLYAQLLRPDDTLPSLGNTVRGSGREGFTGRGSAFATGATSHERALRWIGPQSGLLVWWSAESGVTGNRFVSQTLVTWANFATHAHKHVDEMSLFVWTEQSDILIGAGYWPYGAEHEVDATGWAGANTPHFSSESPARRGETRLVGLASSDELEYVEMERVAEGGGRIGRQIVHLRPDRWIVIDTASDAASTELVSTWTFDPMLTIVPRDARSLEIRGTSEPVGAIQFSGCSGGSLRQLKGSKIPFAGWTAADGRIVPTSAIVRRCPVGEPAALILDTSNSGTRVPERMHTRITSPEDWAITLGSSSTPIAERHGTLIRSASTRCAGKCEAIVINPQPNSSEGASRIDQAYLKLAEQYTRHQEGWRRYRVKISWALMNAWMGFLVVLAAFGIILRERRRLLLGAVSAAAFAGWVGIALWLFFVYFR